MENNDNTFIQGRDDDPTTEAPFYDDYDSEKQYTKILAVPGNHIQSRDFTQSQTMTHDLIRRISDTLLKDGNIVSGMGYNISNGEITVKEGRIYLGGLIHNFKEQTLPFTGEGVETVGVELHQQIITELEDESFLDPAEEMPSSGQPGAYRIRSIPVLVINSEDATVVYEFEDGELEVEASRPQYDVLEDILARRTYETNGSYRVNGLELFTEPLDADDVQLTTEAGVAYIQGYEVRKPVPVKSKIPISKDTDSVIGEPKTFRQGTLNYALNLFPAHSIDRIVATVERTEQVTRGAVLNGQDFLSRSPVTSLRHISDSGGTFTPGEDYILTNDAVDWSPDGREPSVGSTYTVTYWYNKVLVQGEDYEMYQETGAWGETKDYVRFLSGDRPVQDSSFNVDYKYFLARTDLVSMSRRGEIVITRGQSTLPRNSKPPVIDDESLLHLGTVYCPPNSANMRTTTRVVTRLEMQELQRLSRRVNDVEYNQAMTALDREAVEGEPPTDLKGVLVDSFTSVVRSDFGHPDFNIMFALEEGMIMLPLADSTDTDPNINLGNSDIEIWNRVITAPMREIVAINQHHATTTMRINPYLAFNAMARMTLKPEVDNWVEENFIKIENMEFEARNFARWFAWRDQSAGRASVTRAHRDLMGNIELDNGQDLMDWRGGIGSTVTGTVTETTRSVMEESITHMRQRDVEIDCKNLMPNSDNLEAFFDGIRVPLTPLPGYQAGSQGGTVRSNGKGRTRAKFRIPAGIRTGTREVVLRNNSNTASAPYTANGTKRTTTDTILRTRVQLTAVDPLAQSFEFERDTILKSVGAYFASKDNQHNVVVQIRNMVNGSPGTTIFAEEVLEPDDIRTSENASRETKISFDQPVMCSANTQYCMVFLTDSATDSMYIAELGNVDVRTGIRVTRQPYLPGMLFSSSNNKTWTPHQASNLKFKCYVGEFESEGMIEFDPIQNISADKLVLLADFLTPRNTGCIWEMRLDNGSYQPIASFEETELTQVTQSIQLRAIFKADRRMSPILALDSFTLMGFLSDTTGAYISRNVELEQEYTTVKQVFEGHIPPGCTIEPQFSYDNGQTWHTSTRVSETQVNRHFSRYVHEADVPASEQADNFRARLNLTAPSPVVRPRAKKFMNIVK